MISTFTLPVSRLTQLQALVKQHDLRFRGNPSILGEAAHVCLDGSHLPMSACNAFWADWHRLNTPIREKMTPRWKQILRRLAP